MAALIDFSCNLLTNSSPDISLSSHSPSIKAQSGTGWAAVKGQTIYQPVSSCCLLFQPDRLCSSPRPNNSKWLRRAAALHDTNTHIVYIYIYFETLSWDNKRLQNWHFTLTRRHRKYLCEWIHKLTGGQYCLLTNTPHCDSYHADRLTDVLNNSEASHLLCSTMQETWTEGAI